MIIKLYPDGESYQLKIKEETGKYLDNTDILWDIFPKPIGNSLFRSCGNCHHCIGSPGGCSYFNDENLMVMHITPEDLTFGKKLLMRIASFFVGG